MLNVPVPPVNAFSYAGILIFVEISGYPETCYYLKKTLLRDGLCKHSSQSLSLVPLQWTPIPALMPSSWEIPRQVVSREVMPRGTCSAFHSAWQDFLISRCITVQKTHSKASRTSEASEILSFSLKDFLFCLGLTSLRMHISLASCFSQAMGKVGHRPSCQCATCHFFFFLSTVFLFFFFSDETSWTISSYFHRNKGQPKGGSVRQETYTESHFSASAKESADLVEGHWDLKPVLQEATQLYVHINHTVSSAPGRVGFLWSRA